MSEKIIKLIVLFLSILIVIAFFLVIYGMYTKISSKSLETEEFRENVSLLLDEEDFIENYQVIDDNRILITIRNNKRLFALVYDIKNKKIEQKIIK